MEAAEIAETFKMDRIYHILSCVRSRPHLDLLQTVLYNLHLLCDIFCGEELVWVKRITAILCSLMNHHTVGQRCLEGKASYNTK